MSSYRFKAAKAVVLISERFGHSGGGEAIKAQQYADFLQAQGYDIRVITHARSRHHGADLAPEKFWGIEDTKLQLLFWKLRPLRPLLEVYFHLAARRILNRAEFGPQKPILHYISPVSPVALRFPPKGFDVVLGPMTGNIYYPPGFRDRMAAWYRFREGLHRVAQTLFGRVMGDKKNVDILLVSGYERTRASLRMAGCPEDKMIDVVDSGISEKLAARTRITHDGENPRFMCSGRMVDHKGLDLAIRAVGQADPSITLDLYGDGEERPRLEALVAELGLQDRVTFKGWLPDHDDLIDAFGLYRGYVFPSLAEANGIVMQEAMMAGLPVLTARWGGPERLADDDAALYVDPIDEAHVVAELAKHMSKLARDGAFADQLSQKARAIAEARFTWDGVARSWQAAYDRFSRD